MNNCGCGGECGRPGCGAHGYRQVLVNFEGREGGRKGRERGGIDR